MRLLAGLVLIAAACGPTPAAPAGSKVPAATPPVKLSLQYRGGDEDKYTLRKTFIGDVIDEAGHVQSMSFDIRAQEVTRVTTVDSDGTATFEVELLGIAETTSPLPVMPAASQGYQLKLALDASVVGATETPLGGAAYALAVANQPFAILADYAVGPGNSWISDFNREDPLGGAVQSVHANSQFERYEILGGAQVARINTVLSMAVDRELELGGQRVHETGTVSARITSEFDPNVGRFLETETNVRFELTAGVHELLGTQILLLDRSR